MNPLELFNTLMTLITTFVNSVRWLLLLLLVALTITLWLMPN